MTDVTNQCSDFFREKEKDWQSGCFIFTKRTAQIKWCVMILGNITVFIQNDLSVHLIVIS